MRPTRYVTAVLVLAAIGAFSAAFGAVGCSKRGESSQAKGSADPEQPKSAVTASVPAAKQTGEGFEATSAPKMTGSFAEGEAAYQAKKYGDATAIFESYTERRPGNAWGHYMLGLSAWKSGDLTKSEMAFEKALSIDPRHIKSYVNLSRVFIDQKRHDEAIERLTRAAEVDPDSTEVQRLLGRTFYAQGKVDEAVDAYRRAIDLNERDAWSMNNLGLVFLETDRADEALPLLIQAVELRKDVPEFHNNLGMALEHTGRFKAAATAYSGALAADPAYDKAKQNLARVEAVKSGPEEPIDAEKAATAAEKAVVKGDVEDVHPTTFPVDQKTASK